MSSSQTELIATPQFDSGRWKWRLELAPVSAETQTNDEHVDQHHGGFASNVKATQLFDCA
jgi:hypothetical protein